MFSLTVDGALLVSAQDLYARAYLCNSEMCKQTRFVYFFFVCPNT